MEKLKNSIECVVCGSESFAIKQDKEYSINKCIFCGLEFSNPMPNRNTLKKIYLNYNDPRAQEYIVRINSKEIIKYLIKYGLNKNSKLLDFGCGDNILVNMGNSKNWFGYDKYKNLSRSSGKFDFINLGGVLEHLIDPIKTVGNLVQKLKDHGKLIIRTVGTETDIPYQYKYPEHLTWWSFKSIEELFKISNLKLIEIFKYFMFQDPQVYFNCVINAGRVPEKFKKRMKFNIKKEKIFVPTNEIFVIGEKI